MPTCRFHHKYTLDGLLSIRDVLGSPNASAKDFLESCTKSLVYMLLLQRRIPELHEVATTLGKPLMVTTNPGPPICAHRAIEMAAGSCSAALVSSYV